MPGITASFDSVQVEESIRLRALATFMEQQSAEIAPSDHATLVTVISFMLAQIKVGLHNAPLQTSTCVCSVAQYRATDALRL